jgi:dephospho-CoA kinase
MLKVALTGGIATGKSYVLEQFRRRGIPCLDADLLAHGVTAAGTEATAQIASRFGTGVLTPDGSVDRAKLGRIVFADRAARQDLEAIVHPAVYRAITAGIRALELLGTSSLVVVDVPLLYESGHERDFDKVIVTVAGAPTQVARLRARGISDTEASQRMAAQWPTEKKSRRADFIIRTDGAFDETDRQVDAVLASLTGAAGSRAQRD